MQHEGGWVLVSIDSDGQDYIKGTAGAIIDSGTSTTVVEQDIDINKYIESNDTYHLHKKLGTLVEADSTGTNVGDLHVFLSK